MRRHDQSSLFFRLLHRASAGLGWEAYSSRFTSGQNRLANSAFIGRATLRHRNQQARQWLAIPLSRGANSRRLGAFGMPNHCALERQRRPDALPLSYRQTTISPFAPVLGRSKTAVLARDARRAFLSKRSCHDTDQRACSDCYFVAGDGDIVGSVGLLSGLGAGRDSSSLPQRRVRGRYSGRWRRLSDFIVPDFTVVTPLARPLPQKPRRLLDRLARLRHQRRRQLPAMRRVRP